MTVRILQGDCRDVLKTLPDESVHGVVTSPPYFGLRDYGTAKWEGGDEGCDHRQETKHQSQGATSARAGRSNVDAQKNENFHHECGKCGARRVDGQIGLEPTPDAFVAEMVAVFREVRRVLRSDGTLWLNLGDSYAGSWGAQSRGDDTPGTLEGGSMLSARQIAAHPKGARTGSKDRFPGLKPKDLIGIPWRVAFALQADGWWLRQWHPWVKRNPMPESTKDRPTSACETIFLLTKSERCYYDYEAVKRPFASGPSDLKKMAESADQIGGKHKTLDDPLSKASAATKIGRKRSVGNKQAAMAALSNPSTERRMGGFNDRWDESEDNGTAPAERALRNSDFFFKSLGALTDDDGEIIAFDVPTQPFRGAHFATFPPRLIEPCILAGCPKGGVVLDPFGGAGTTGLVADRLGRDAVLIELNPEYAAMAERRIKGDANLLSDVRLESPIPTEATGAPG